MAPQLKSRLNRATIAELACDMHEQLLWHPEDMDIDHVFAALIPKGIDPTDTTVLSSISPTEPVLLHRDADGFRPQPFNCRFDFLSFSIHGDALEQLQHMRLPKGSAAIAVNMLVKDGCMHSDHCLCDYRCSTTSRLSLVVSRRHTAGVVSDEHNPPMFFDENSGIIIEAMQDVLARTPK